MKLRFLIFALFAIGANFSVIAQILEPVKWDFTTKQTADTEHELIFTAKIEKGWTVYSQWTSDDGPVPTEIIYESIEGAEALGKSKEDGHKKEGLDKLFDVNVIKFLDDQDFTITQKVKVTDDSKPISGYLTYMTCNDKTCLPPTDVDFSFAVKNSAEKVKDLGLGGNEDAKKNEEEINAQLGRTLGQNEEEVDQIDTKIAKPSTVVTPVKQDIVRPVASTTTTTDGIGSTADQKESKIFEPVKWGITKSKLSDNEYEIVYRAAIDDGWAVYSQYMEEGGPVITSITYENKDGVELIGKSTEEGHRKEGPDPMFIDDIDVVVKFLDDEDFVIRQKIKVVDAAKPFSGYLTFMTCDNKRCLNPQDIDFAFDFSGKGKSAGVAPSMNEDASGKIDQTRAIIKTTVAEPLSNCGESTRKDDGSLWWLLIAGMLGGFAALLTPCVFPMIPITVSFFTKDTKRKGWMNALIYGVSIIVIYVFLGLLITMTLGPETLQALSTNWIANTLFFLIFMFFAFSFFGFYEITLPSSWSTKSDAMADKGGLIGIFFMAATLALVSFSCTGPIVGSALVAAAEGGLMGPLVVMFGFSFALALPFGLFAAFPAWLNSLPKSGGWMNSVKVVLGFLEVGFAFKFLSIADLTEHWGILKYETFMFIIVTICLLIAAYLFGFIKFPHDSPIKKLSMARKAIATSFIALAIYFGFGFTINPDTGIYRSLNLISGISPPVMYNMFLSKGEVDPEIKKRFPSFTKCANNIDCFKDYYEGMAYAKEIDKPVFIDFTGHGCVNCRRTEDRIWVDNEVRQTLNDDVVLISLYTDDRKKLEKPFISAYDNKKKRNVGNQWADFQVVNFDQNSQPLYIMMTPDEEVVTHPRGYEEGIGSYQEYLKCGLDAYAGLK